MSLPDILLRLGAAVVFGIGIGLNRYLHHKSIGVRTLGLLSITSAGLVIAVLDINNGAGLPQLVQGIVTGIGFIGAGLIMHRDGQDRIHGLTTAACVWLAAGVGVLCGLGAWTVLLPTAVFVAALLLFGGGFEKAIEDRYGEPKPKKSEPLTPVE